jgi:DNA gyrase/topoisomerase IV subunit B
MQVTTKGKGGGEHYLYDQAAMDTFMKALPDNASPSIQRFKGLGEGPLYQPCTFLSSFVAFQNP